MKKTSQSCDHHHLGAELVCATPSCRFDRLVCGQRECAQKHHGHHLRPFSEYSQQMDKMKKIMDTRTHLRQVLEAHCKRTVGGLQQQLLQQSKRFLTDLDRNLATPLLLEMERKQEEAGSKKEVYPELLNIRDFNFDAYSKIETQLIATKMRSEAIFPLQMSQFKKRVDKETRESAIQQLLPFRCQLHLRFQASKNGFLSKLMHSKDVRGPILLVVQSVKGRVFGGYASAPFPKDEKAERSERRPVEALLFSLDHGRVLPLREEEKRFALRGGKHFGFGRGDLLIADECHKGNLSWAEVGRSFVSPPNVACTREWLAGEHFFRVAEYQLYQLQFLGNK